MVENSAYYTDDPRPVMVRRHSMTHLQPMDLDDGPRALLALGVLPGQQHGCSKGVDLSGTSGRRCHGQSPTWWR